MPRMSLACAPASFMHLKTGVQLGSCSENYFLLYKREHGQSSRRTKETQYASHAQAVAHNKFTRSKGNLTLADAKAVRDLLLEDPAMIFRKSLDFTANLASTQMHDFISQRHAEVNGSRTPREPQVVQHCLTLLAGPRASPLEVRNTRALSQAKLS